MEFLNENIYKSALDFARNNKRKDIIDILSPEVNYEPEPKPQESLCTIMWNSIIEIEFQYENDIKIDFFKNFLIK